jgi:uncharacterized membrane protein HdeD (DUF308 family)
MAVDTQQVYAKIRENSGWYWGGGILFVLMGAVAIILPLVATLALTLIIGILFIIGGVYELSRAFRHRGAGRVFGAALFGVLALAAGIVLLLNPIGGAITLALFLGVYLIVSGVFRAIAAFDLRPAKGWGWMLFGALVSLLLGILIVIWLPQSGLWVLGLLVGIDFLFFGSTLIAIAIAAGKLPQQ